RRREVVESLEEGMCVVDGTGRVTLWNDALERITGCKRGHALGRALVAAVPALGKTELRRAIDGAVASRSARTVTLGLTAATGTRIVQLKIVPVGDDVTLLLHDVTERAQAERALRRSEERLALAASGANDGWWEWDLRSQDFFASDRWRAMIGVPDSEGVGRLENWTDRVHPDDIGPLKEALEAHFSGQTDHFHHEH